MTKSLTILPLLAGLAVALGRSGCSSEPHAAPVAPEPLASTSTPDVSDVAPSTDAGDEDSDSDPQPSATVIHSDPAVMEKMACKALTPSLLKSMELTFGYPTRSVQVKVGEGLTPGEMWWVVILDSPPDDSHRWGIRPFLTNAPGLEHGGKGTWITLGETSPWESVSWPDEKLVTAQSALERAYGCLEK